MSEICATTGEPCGYRAAVNLITDEFVVDGAKNTRAAKKAVQKIDETIGAAQLLCTEDECGLALIAAGLSIASYAVNRDMTLNIERIVEE